MSKKLSKQSDCQATSDLALATALATKFPIKEINSDDPKRVIFFFHKSKELEEMVKLYWDKQCLIDAQTYFQQLRQIKSRLYNKN